MPHAFTPWREAPEPQVSLARSGDGPPLKSTSTEILDPPVSPRKPFSFSRGFHAALGVFAILALLAIACLLVLVRVF